MSEPKTFPRRLSLSKLFDILVAYLNAGADKEYVGVSEVVSKSNVTLHNISRNNNFLKGWGFVEGNEKKPGKYKLSREAAEFAHAYRIDPNGVLTRDMLRNILAKDEVLAKFIEHAKNENLGRDVLLVELPRVVGDLRADKVGLTAFLDMLTYAFQFEEGPKPLRKSRQLREVKASKPAKRVERPSPRLEVSSRATISINLTISPEVSPEKLKEYVKAVLEAYDEHKVS